MNFIEAVKEMVEKNRTCIYQDGSEYGVIMRYSSRNKQFMKSTEEYGWYKIEFDKYHYTSDSWELFDNWYITGEEQGVEIAPGTFHYTRKELEALKKYILNDIIDDNNYNDMYQIDIDMIKNILYKRFGF